MTVPSSDPSLSPASAGAAGLAVLDRATAIARLGGSVERFERLLPVFRNTLQKAADTARAAIAAEAHDALARTLHDVKGMAGTLAAPALAFAAGQAEAGLRAGGTVHDASVGTTLRAITALLHELG